MSHYSVCVAIPSARLIGREITGCVVEEILDEILAPYDEGTCDYRYMTFDDRTGEARANYETEKTVAIKFPDGTIHSRCDSAFEKRFVVHGGRILEKISGDTIETPNSRSLELVADYPVREIYTFREYCALHCAYSEDHGRWGYWSNPNSRWDWYSIGGRHSGAFLVDRKLGQCLDVRDGVDEDPGFKHADGARKGDVAWAETCQRARKEAILHYTLLRRCFESGDVKELGPFAVLTDDGIRGWGEMLYRKGEGRDEYLKRRGVAPDDRYVLNCYSFVDSSGRWHSMGDMGWFGLSANDKEERAWHDEIQEFLTELDDDDFLVMVDCHI